MSRRKKSKSLGSETSAVSEFILVPAAATELLMSSFSKKSEPGHQDFGLRAKIQH